MPAARWLIADLRRQTRAVEALAAETDLRRRDLERARHSFLRETLARPETLAGLFAAGWLLGSGRHRSGDAARGERSRLWKLLGTTALWLYRRELAARTESPRSATSARPPH